MKSPSAKCAAAAVLVVATLVGGGSLLLFALFLWRGSFGVVDLGLEAPWLYLWDALLCAGFFGQHSVMVRRSFQTRWMAGIPAPARGASYAIASGLALFLVVLLWQESPLYHGEHDRPVVQILAAGWGLAAVIFVWSLAALRTDVLGLAPLWGLLRGAAPRPPVLVVRGPYRFVRHPLYLASLLVIWAGPELSADRLLLDILFTGWILVGAKLEERDLEDELGDAYRRYREAVPMLLPWRIPDAIGARK
ncbi:MAG: isoprenylcysteine carboxylmethyltransferase family protein [Planctomycetota bacterium]